jgi:putative sterol carrier protein
MSVAAERGPATADISYADLYRRWEKGNWSAYDIDFSADRAGYEALNEIQKKSALWIYSMFFYGEDSVTDNLSPFIDAAPTEEMKYFLATQQVDEARHAIFFHRFFKEVIGVPGEDLASTLSATLPQLGWGYRNVFDRLDRMADELRKDRSLPKFAQAITLYHLVVEGTLAQPGQHFIEDFFASAGTMPGFNSGMSNVSRDEQRHIGFGVKVLSEILPQSEECKAAVAELLRDVMRYSIAVFIPPGGDERYTTEYGFTLEDIYSFGLRLVRQRWRTIGWPIEEMPPGIFPFDHSQSEEEIARRQIALMRAGVVGEPNGRQPQSNPEVQSIFFDIIARSANPEAVNGKSVTYQWRFSDADPWYVVVANGSTRAEPGEASNPNLTFETSWKDWIGVTLGDEDPRKLMLRRRIRPRGSIREILRSRKVFPPR